MRLRKQVKIFIVSLLAILSMQWFFMRHTDLLLIEGLLSLIIIVQLESYYRLQQRFEQQSWRHYGQLEALFFLHSSLKLRHPLPPMRGWAISPDFATTLISLIREYKPQTIVEMGSGASTIISAYCLESLDQGQIISLDHEEQYAATTRLQLRKHALQHCARVIYAPLVSHEIQQQNWRWYDTAELEDIDTIDMLIIDGPPESTQAMARFPALPLLISRLSEQAVILLDDTLRADEKAMISRWLQEFSDFQLEHVVAEKGATILRRNPVKQAVVV